MHVTPDGQSNRNRERNDLESFLERNAKRMRAYNQTNRERISEWRCVHVLTHMPVCDPRAHGGGDDGHVHAVWPGVRDVDPVCLDGV